MNAGTSDRRPVAIEQRSDDAAVTATDNDAVGSTRRRCSTAAVPTGDVYNSLQVCKKKKKLGLTLELAMMQFKNAIVSRTERDNENGAPPNAAARRDSRAAGPTDYADGLRRLDRAKGEHAADMERFAADADRTIAWLRAAVEDAHGAYETRRRQLFERCADAAGRGRPADDGAAVTADDSGLWRLVVRSVREDNRSLEAAADRLDDEMARLQDGLRDAAAGYAALDADKSDQRCAAVALDDFCAVAEQIAAEQIRNMEFGRTLAADDGQIAGQLNDIGRLNVKISKKRNKRDKLLEETDGVRRELEAYRTKYEDLERRKALLGDDDSTNARRSSSGETADPSESQAVGHRMKHLKQLKVQYNGLANRRDALKLKLQKQQTQLAKTWGVQNCSVTRNDATASR